MTAVPPRPAAPEVGRCGNTSPSFIGAPPDICALPAGHAGWHRGDPPLQGRATEWSDAPDATAGDGLREARRVARDHAVEVRLSDGKPAFTMGSWKCSCGAGGANGSHGHADHVGERVEAALRDVLATAARDAEKVRRVRELADELDREVVEAGFVLDRIVPPGDRIRRALDPS